MKFFVAVLIVSGLVLQAPGFGSTVSFGVATGKLPSPWKDCDDPPENPDPDHFE